VVDDARKARDIALLDAVDAFSRAAFKGTAWRVTRAGRDPLLGAASRSRWCTGGFDVLYTSLERDGALAEIFALLNSQPVFPSKPRWHVHRLSVGASRTLRLADLPTLARLGVDVARYRERDYARTQAIADAAYFLDFDGLVAPSARWDCLNLVLFTDRIAPADLVRRATEADPIDWQAWRKKQAAR
jgi:RES domain-containing protein